MPNGKKRAYTQSNIFTPGLEAFESLRGLWEENPYLASFNDWLTQWQTHAPLHLTSLPFPISLLPSLPVDPAQCSDWLNRYTTALQNSGSKDISTDKRFAANSWKQHEFAHQIAALYSVHEAFLDEFITLLKLPPKQQAQIKFSLDQWLAAIAPSNYLAFNPEALQILQETKGESLSRGLAHLLEDLHKGRISQTNEAVFEVGKNVATTPGAVVYENPFMQLIQYQPLTKTVFKRPLLIVPPCINKFYILDLQAENSFVRYAIEQGHTVFLISWRNPLPDASDQESFGNIEQASWDDYLSNGPLTALEVVSQISKADKINTLGFCVGGTLLSAALAALAAKKQFPAASLTLLTTLLDFSEPGILGVYVDEQQVALREATLSQSGLMPGRELASSFSSLRPNDLIWNYVVNNYLKGQSPPAFDLLYWNSDSTNLPGPMFVQYLRRLYLDNALAKTELESLGVRLDLKKINLPSYVLAAREDHIVPWKSAYASAQHLKPSAKKPANIRFVLAAAGHIAGVINPANKNKRSFWSTATLPDNAEQWFSAAKETPGSWWADWSKWLAAYGGSRIPAPKNLGSPEHKVIEPAPGRYVKVRAV